MSKAGLLWTSRLLRWGLAAVFALAAVLKVMDPYRFAEDIRNYLIMPWWSLHALALLLPWIELVCAAALVINKWPAEAATILIAMLVVYIVVLSSTIIRGIDVHCGCFGKYDTSSAVMVILRDFVLLGMAVGVILVSRRRRA